MMYIIPCLFMLIFCIIQAVLNINRKASIMGSIGFLIMLVAFLAMPSLENSGFLYWEYIFIFLILLEAPFTIYFLFIEISGVVRKYKNRKGNRDK